MAGAYENKNTKISTEALWRFAPTKISCYTSHLLTTTVATPINLIISMLSGAHNKKERLTTEHRLSSNTLYLTIYGKWRADQSVIISFLSQLCAMRT